MLLASAFAAAATANKQRYISPHRHHSCSSLFLQDGAGIIEKEDLVAKVKQVAAAGPEGEAPAGYTFDAATGYYHSAGELALFLD